MGKNKKEFWRIIGVLLVTVLLLVGVFLGVTHARNTIFEIHINDKTFPDCAFRNYVFNEIDINNDGLLTKDEIGKTTAICEIYVDTYDLKGIEYFVNLEVLDINGSNVGRLNLSSNHNLKELNVSDTNIQMLDLSGNPLLNQENVVADEDTIIIFRS